MGSNYYQNRIFELCLQNTYDHFAFIPNRYWVNQFFSVFNMQIYSSLFKVFSTLI